MCIVPKVEVMNMWDSVDLFQEDDASVLREQSMEVDQGFGYLLRPPPGEGDVSNEKYHDLVFKDKRKIFGWLLEKFDPDKCKEAQETIENHQDELKIEEIRDISQFGTAINDKKRHKQWLKTRNRYEKNMQDKLPPS